MMNGRALRRSILVIGMLLISSCQTKVINFRPPDQEEPQDFSKDQGINPIVDKVLDHSAVLSYEKEASFNYYVLTVQEPDGEWVVSSNVAAAKSDQPILMIRQKTGDQLFIAIVIQDTTLLAETTAIEAVIFSQNRLTSTTNNKRA